MKGLLTTLCLTIAVLLGSAGAAQAFDETSLKKLKALNACVGCDLSGANLTGADLTRAKLFYVNLSGANLTKANLSYEDLSKANLKNANIKDANFCKTQTPWGEDNSGC